MYPPPPPSPSLPSLPSFFFPLMTKESIQAPSCRKKKVLPKLERPFRLVPQFKHRLWGGERLKAFFEKEITAPRCAEAWLLSSIPGSSSLVADDNYPTLSALIEAYGATLMGESVYQRFHTTCPLLVKLIDAKAPLSIQVHPPDALAQQRHGERGKTEAWYILAAERGAKIVNGFSRPMSKAKYMRHARQGTLHEVLHLEDVVAGNCFFVPAGRIHNTGAGILMAEVQTCSDITYRIDDFQRLDPQTHKPRALHIEEAAAALDFSLSTTAKKNYEAKKNAASLLINDPSFVLHKIHCHKYCLPRHWKNKDSFVVLVCLSGKAYWQGSHPQHLPLNAGDCILIPASLNHYGIGSDEESTLLEAYVPNKDSL